MAVMAQEQITLITVKDIKTIYRYYLLQGSALDSPTKPETYPAPPPWVTSEPAYTAGSLNSLYFVDCTVYSDDSFKYSDVSMSSNYEAAKAAYVIAAEAQNIANDSKAVSEEALIKSAEAQNEANIALQESLKASESSNNAQAKAEEVKAEVENIEKEITDMETDINDVQTATQNAQNTANLAEQKAEEANIAAQNAQKDADIAAQQASTAQEAANTADEKATTAQGTAADAKLKAEEAQITLNNIQQEVADAEKEIENLGQELDTLSQTMSTDYAKKGELTDVQAHLQTQITQNAGEITSTANKVLEVDETANNAAEQALAAQQAAQAAQEQANAATMDAQTAQQAADAAALAAQTAQQEADNAKAAANTAQAEVNAAEAELAKAKSDLAEVTKRVGATEEEIEAAQTAVNTAQAAADKAKEDAANAATAASNAQSTADTAKTNAQAAQSTADQANAKALAAQQAADNAQGSADAAQATADQAKQTAETAQTVATTAKNNAAAAQSTADDAAEAAEKAQKAADDADTKAVQAAADLAVAKQNLVEVTSRVDATEEDIAAAEAAVATAQAAANAAQADADAAQVTANTAKTNAANAQTAANNAKTAADNAQKAADEARSAADAAQAAADALAIRVTNAETKITQNSEQIKLMATKTEVAETLGGYYTIEETEAAIELSADAVKSSVSSTYKKIQWHTAAGTSGTKGYVGIAEIKISSSYMNRPIYFGLRNRGTNASDVYVRFNNVNSADPTLQSIRENGDVGTWILKTGTSTWQLIALKSEAYDQIYVVGFDNTNTGITVTWKNAHYDSLPTENITAASKMVGTQLASDIATKTEVTQLNDKIVANVEETNGLKSRMSTVEQTASDLTVKLEETTSDVETAKENAAAAQNTADTALSRGVEYIVGTQTAATNAWTGVSKDSSLYTGKKIAYKLPYAGTSSAATLNLTLADGSTTGAKGLRRLNSTVTTNYVAGSVVDMTYDGTYWRISDYDSNTYDRVRYNQAIKCGTTAIVAANIIVGASGVHKHLKAGTAFDISYPILYASSAIAASATGTNNYLCIPFAVKTTQNLTLTAYKPVYIKGKLSGKMFTPISTAPLTQTEPTSEDGYYYILLGNAYSTTNLYLTQNHPIYKYFNGSFKSVEQIAVEASQTATNYLNFSSAGLVIGDMTADILGQNILIDTDSMDIRIGETVLASFGANMIELGKNSADTTISMCGGLATIVAEEDSSITFSADGGLYLISDNYISGVGKEIQFRARNLANTSSAYFIAYADSDNNCFANLEMTANNTQAFALSINATESRSSFGIFADHISLTSRGVATSFTGLEIINFDMRLEGTSLETDSHINAQGYINAWGGMTTGGNFELYDPNDPSQADTPYIYWSNSMNGKEPYIGYATDQTDGTFLWSIEGTNYASGLAIGGGSGNLLYKAKVVLHAGNYETYCAKASHTHSYLPLTGGTLTGNLSGKYITGTWLQTTATADLGSTPSKIAVLDASGWIYYRTPAELLSDIGAVDTSVVSTMINSAIGEAMGAYY